MNLPKIARRALLLFTLLVGPFALAEETPARKPDPWQPVRFLLGKWEGDVQGEPGTGKATREYALILHNKFIEIRNQSTYPPQEKNPKGEVHQDRGMVLDSVSPDGRTVVFVSVAIENIPAGFRGRETYTSTGDDTFTELFEMAEPGKEFTRYSETHFTRAKP